VSTRADDNRTAFGRLVLGAAVLAAAALPARRPRPPRLELDSFEAVNDLPDSLYAPIWPLMQFGSLAAVPVTAAAVWAGGDRGRARRLLVAGAATWALAKGVKRVVRRGRPVAVGPVRVRGQAQSGDGFVSGHAAVAVALAAGTMRSRPGLDPLLAILAAVVGVSRMYVGAHLPLDVLGGAALGFIVDASVELAWPGPGS
jgi:undecaprenyl-diphosphatase